MPNILTPPVAGLPNIPDIDQKIPTDLKVAAGVSKPEKGAGSSEQIQEVKNKAGEISQMKSQSADHLADTKFSQSNHVQQIQKEVR